MRLVRWTARHWLRLVALMLACTIVGSAAIVTDTLGAGYAFSRVLAHVALILDPPPDRPTVATVDVTPEPTDTVSPAPPVVTVPGVTPSPTPARVPVDVNLLANPTGVFISEIKDIWCAPAGTTIVLTILGHGTNTNAFETQLAGQIRQWDSWSDSHDGGWGPAAIALALAAYGVPGYQVRAYTTLAAEVKDAAIALSTTHEPVVLMAWYGAHTWVMTGYRASADPTLFHNASIGGAYIEDPWYPRVSTLWGRSAAPGAFHTMANLGVNVLPWRRPEGYYPARDLKFIAVVPTKLAPPMGPGQ
ncbi:MAG: hypothetical protein ACHQZR_07430 [Candidatus Limnocylindrales bacterium]